MKRSEQERPLHLFSVPDVAASTRAGPLPVTFAFTALVPYIPDRMSASMKRARADVLDRSARGQLALAVLACAVLTILAHYPGQMSVDTVLQLYDGHTRAYVSNQPPSMSLLLASLTPGGMLILDVALYATSVMVLLAPAAVSVRRKLAVAVLLFFYPVVGLYNGILWKDVLFANLALLGFLLLPALSTQRRWRRLVLSGALFGVACQVRQQGLTAAVAAALAVPLIAPQRGGWRTRFGELACWGGGWVAASLLAIAAVTVTAVRQESVSTIGPLYQIAVFDLAGITAHTSGLGHPLLERAGVDRAALHRKFSRYDPSREDTLAEDAGTRDPLYGVDLPTLSRAWWSAVRQHPEAYLLHRLDAFAWLLGLHAVTECLPIYSGISAQPAKMVHELGLRSGVSRRAKALAAVEWRLLFLYHPIAYALVSVSLIGCFLRRNRARHAAMFWLQISGVAYLAQYLVISIACDFRYAYFTVLAAVFGVAHTFIHGLSDRASVAPR